MNDETSAAFPDPPYFYTFFTASNLAALPPSTSSIALPPDSPLKFLIPPPPPPDGSYTTFTTPWTFPERHRTLADAGIPVLYPQELDAPSASQSQSEDGTQPPAISTTPISSPHRIIALRRLSKSLLLAFLELVGIMSVSPLGPDGTKKLEDFQNLLFNTHHLINGYRAHHAREQLADLMEEQVRRVEEEARENWRIVGKVEEALRGVGEVGRRVEEEEKVEMEGGGGGDEGWVGKDGEGWGLIERAVAMG